MITRPQTYRTLLIRTSIPVLVLISAFASFAEGQDGVPPVATQVLCPAAEMYSDGYEFTDPDNHEAEACGPVAQAPWPSRVENCQCGGQYVCTQVCFALARGHAITKQDFYHLHPMFDPTDNSCRGALGHAHEIDNLRTGNPNNFNISTYQGTTQYLPTPPPNTLHGLSGEDWDAATGQWGNRSRTGWVYFKAEPQGGCPSTDITLSCACGGSVGDMPICLENCSLNRTCNKFSTGGCADKVVRSDCTTAAGGAGKCIEGANYLNDCSCEGIPETLPGQE